MVTDNLAVLFVASEADGLIKSGGLADVARALPEGLISLGQDVRLAIPAYRPIAGLRDAPLVLRTELDHWPHTEYQVRELRLGTVRVYGIECDRYFDRPHMYAEQNQAYMDNGERFAFFSAASLDMLPKLGFQPHIIHANDWHTGLVPYLLRQRYRDQPFFQAMRSVLSVHNAVFKGVFSYDELRCIPEFHTKHVPEAAVSATHITMLKAGVMTADKIVAVSPTYAEELKTELGSHGMGREFQQRSADLVGILNGCDYQTWNPRTDTLIPANYSEQAESLALGKQKCKSELQSRVGLPVVAHALYGMVCRLTHQKGIQYLLPILADFLRHDVQVVIVGTGELAMASKLAALAQQFPDKLKFIDAYDNELAHWVEAGADFFLMPSEFEPCGLNQIYSMAYGTLPIVRSVGGLKDTVVDYLRDRDNATGFVFDEPQPAQLLITMLRSLLVYEQNPQQLLTVQQRAMQQDFCWREAAKQYLELYQALLLEKEILYR